MIGRELIYLGDLVDDPIDELLDFWSGDGLVQLGFEIVVSLLELVLDLDHGWDEVGWLQLLQFLDQGSDAWMRSDLLKQFWIETKHTPINLGYHSIPLHPSLIYSGHVSISFSHASQSFHQCPAYLTENPENIREYTRSLHNFTCRKNNISYNARVLQVT